MEEVEKEGEKLSRFLRRFCFREQEKKKIAALVFARDPSSLSLSPSPSLLVIIDCWLSVRITGRRVGNEEEEEEDYEYRSW